MGERLDAAGVDPASFTAASLKGVSKDGQIYGMPFDTWAPLWHINLNYFRQPGWSRRQARAADEPGGTARSGAAVQERDRQALFRAGADQ